MTRLRSTLNWVAAFLLAAGTVAAAPAGAPSTWDLYCQQLVDRAVEDGVSAQDAHLVLVTLGWRSLLEDRQSADGFLDRLTAAAEDPLVVDLLRSWRARLAVEEGRVALARELFRAQGGLERWWASGPRPIEELGDIGQLPPWPEKAGWRKAGGTDGQGWLDLTGAAWPSERQVLYLATTVASDARRAVAVRVGGSQAVRLWVNGAEVASTEFPVEHGEDQVSGGAWLERGPNLVVAAVAVERGGWWLRVRLTAPDGGALEGVQELADPPVRREVPEEGPAPPVRTLRGELEAAAEKGVPGARAALAAVLVQRRPGPVGSGLARAACRKAREEAPVLARWLEWLVTDEPGDARALLQGVLERDPDFLPARIQMAVWLHRRGLHQAAHRVLTEGGRGGSALAATDLDLDADLWGELALPELERLQAAGATCVRLLTTLARRSMDAGRWTAARRAMADLERLVPGSRKVSSLALRLATADGDVSRLQALLVGRLQAHPNHLDTTLRLVRLHAGQGRLSQALALLEGAVARCPGHPGLTVELAELNHAAGRDAEAERLARAVLEVRPQDRRAQRLLHLLGSGTEDRSWARTPEALRAMAAKAEDLSGPWVQLLDHHEVRLLPGNLTEERVQRAYLVKDPDRSDPLRQRSIAVVPERQRLRVLAARILRPGAEVSARQSETPRLADPAFNLYYDTRLRILEFPKLEAGDVVEVTYLLSETAESNETGPYRGGMILLAGAVPVLREEVVLDAPRGSLPAWELAGTHLEPRHETAQGRERLLFAWDRVPPVPPDVPAPPPLLVTPHLVYSTRPDWGDLAEWYARHVAPRLRVSQDVRRLAQRLTADATSREERIRALAHYVTDEVRYVGLEFGEHRFRPFSADWVLRHRMGDCKDKAALLVTLLRAVGIEAHMVLLRTADQGPVVSKLAILEDFNHAIAYVPGDDLWLDGTATGADPESLPGADRHAWALVVRGADSRPAFTPAGPAGTRRLRFRVGPAGDTTLAVEVEERGTGDAAQALRGSLGGSRDRTRLERWLQGWFPGAAVEGTPEVSLEPGHDPATVTVRGTLPRSAVRAGGGLKVFPGSIRLASRLTPTESRRTPLLLTARPRLRWTVSVAGRPGGPLPRPVHLENRWARFDLQVRDTGDGFEVTGDLRLHAGVVPAAEVPALRELLAGVEKACDQRLEVP